VHGSLRGRIAQLDTLIDDGPEVLTIGERSGELGAVFLCIPNSSYANKLDKERSTGEEDQERQQNRRGREGRSRQRLRKSRSGGTQRVKVEEEM